ncbi:MAG: ribosome recycling factor [Candidatus Eisenbacteria bacterium RBG_19FT_COMBO_70_11]|nr:MAG: ribosome recycling factor [Candidatus Eisenbacteria bacterium RBG_19FT_COMBO_70_11]
MMDQILADTEERMKRQLEAVRRELSGIRSGKASPALLDTVKVEAYGQHVPIQQVGSVSAPEPRLLVVQPWDKSLIKAIMRAIQQSELGLNPTDDGGVIRVPIPSLTEERRRDMVKLVARLAEEGRVHVRQARHDVNKEIKTQEHDGALAEDEAKRLVAEVQKLTDRYVAQVDELLKKKTSEIMEV